jgi:NadR type nicotinamide-nucleotide adenylyltransferase
MEKSVSSTKKYDFKMKRIAFVGPESSGKTSLANYFSTFKNSTVVPEFSRIYLAKTNGKYQFEDIEQIARLQFDNIQKAINDYVWIDTELLVTLVWSEYKYKKCAPFILEHIDKQNIDLFVLCKPDIPWEYDPLRENPYDRFKLFEIYEKKLIAHNLNYIIVNGSLENRIQQIKSNLLLF